MEPLERLLNLVGLLLETRMPLTFEQIRATLEPYGQENVDSAKRMFERDKDILRDYGVPLELVDTDAWGTEQGYVIPKEKYYLPEISFTPEELGALLVAAQGVRKDSPAEEAVRKLMVGAEGGVLAGLAGGPLASGSDARGPLVMAVAAAAQGHRRVRFGYRTSKGHGLGTRRRRVTRRSFERALVPGRLRPRTRGGAVVPALAVHVGPHRRGRGKGAARRFPGGRSRQAGRWTAAGEERATVAFDPEAAAAAMLWCLDSSYC